VITARGGGLEDLLGEYYAALAAGDPGRLPLAAISPDEIDRVLGCVLSYADDNFDQALMLGFASSIRKEFAWRVKRGESLANLRPFARITDAVEPTLRDEAHA